MELNPPAPDAYLQRCHLYLYSTVDLVEEAGRWVGQLGHPSPRVWSCSSNRPFLTAPSSTSLPPQLRNTNHAWLTHCPGKRSIQVTWCSTAPPASLFPIPGSTSPGPSHLAPSCPSLPTPLPGTLSSHHFSAFLRHPPRSCCVVRDIAQALLMLNNLAHSSHLNSLSPKDQPVMSCGHPPEDLV